MPAVKRTKLIEMFWKVHSWLYEKSGGLIGGKAMGMPVSSSHRSPANPATRIGGSI